MKEYVYIVEWFTAEPYENDSGPYKAFKTEQSAIDYVKERGEGPHGVDEKEHDPGYFLIYLNGKLELYE